MRLIRLLTAAVVAFALVSAVTGEVLPAVSAQTGGDARIVAENQAPGSSGWKLRKASDDVGLQIKGFASASSVNIGKSIDFHVSTALASQYTIEIYRMGWYQGLGGRLLTTLGPFQGQSQAKATVNSATGMITTNWPTSASLTVPSGWNSGAYLARLVRADGYDNHIPFVVRDDSRQADLLVQLPFSTYQAYNRFPNDGQTGKSLYDFNSFGAVPTDRTDNLRQSTKVSFDRPYDDDGNGQFFEYDFPAIRFMEREGYNVVYSTSEDTQAQGNQLTRHKAFISLGHDEYWSAEMYDAAERARDNSAGDTDLAFLGANDVYWRIKWEASPITGRSNRVIASNRNHNVDLWRKLGRPEQQLVGVMYESPFGFDYQPIVVASSAHPVWQGTGAQNGTRIPGLVGYEIDTLQNTYPAPVTKVGTSQTLLAQSPFLGNTHATSIYQAPSGSFVFASGTMNWSWGLGNPDQPASESAVLQQAMRNVFNIFLTGNPAAPPTGDPGASDTSRPTAQILLPADGAAVGNNFTISGNVTDNVGVQNAFLFVKDSNNRYLQDDLRTLGAYRKILLPVASPGAKSTTFSTQISGLPSGSYRIYVRARDSAGNEGLNDQVDITVNATGSTTPPASPPTTTTTSQTSTTVTPPGSGGRDVTRPSSRLDSPTEGQTVGQSFAIRGSISDDTATGFAAVFVKDSAGRYLQDDLASFGGYNKIFATLDNPRARESTFSLQLSDLAPGAYRVYVRGRDAAGNEEAVNKTANVTVDSDGSGSTTTSTTTVPVGRDLVRPVSVLSSPREGDSSAGAFTLSGSVTDETAVGFAVVFLRNKAGDYLQNDLKTFGGYNKILWDLDQPGARTSSFTMRLQNLPADSYRVYLRGRDAAGNEGTNDRVNVTVR